MNFKSPGLWLFVGALVLLFAVHLAELLYSGYSTSENFISDLGVGPEPSRAIFTAGLVAFGLMVLFASIQVRSGNEKSPFWIFLALSGIGAIGVGLFNEDAVPLAHGVSAFLAFLFGNLSAIYSFRLAPRPMSSIFAALGLLGLVALAMFGSDVHLGLGVGGMERMVFYPAMFWMLGYGAYLMSKEAAENPMKLG